MLLLEMPTGRGLETSYRRWYRKLVINHQNLRKRGNLMVIDQIREDFSMAVSLGCRSQDHRLKCIDNHVLLLEQLVIIQATPELE